MPIFHALYYTENENDDGFRAIEASNMQEAKEILKAQILHEANHGAYHLSCMMQK